MKVGDRVISISTYSIHNGELGNIIRIDEGSICVKFDNYINRRSGGGIGKRGHCYWLYKDDIELLNKQNQYEIY